MYNGDRHITHTKWTVVERNFLEDINKFENIISVSKKKLSYLQQLRLVRGIMTMWCIWTEAIVYQIKIKKK